ncbi:MAG TPA: hypothetical protein V6D17_07745 [Candidatus Obscuribacterales bacterium]
MADKCSSNQTEAAKPIVSDLSQAQVEQLVSFVQSWHVGYRQSEPDREAVRDALTRLYRTLKMDMPPILWCESPWQLIGMKALLAISGTTSGYDDQLFKDVTSQLKNERWARMCKHLQQQMDAIRKPSIDNFPCSMDQLFGSCVTGDLKTEISTRLTKAQDILKDQLSLSVKLRLREAFRDTTQRERFWTEHIPMFVTQFGLNNLSMMTGSNVQKEFLDQLNAETRAAIERLCKERIKSKTGMFGLTPPNATPFDPLFDALHDTFSPPASTPGFQPAAFVLKHLPVQMDEDMRTPLVDWLTVKENVLHIDCLENLCILCELPIAIRANERSQLHNPDGPAMEFRDGWKVFAWNGVVLPEAAILSPQNITVEQIESEQNVEVRRILIQRYGMERYLQDAGAVQIDADEYGVLYKRVLTNDEPVVVVRVTNPTPEPDGTHKFYFLRVPPHITSARAAVAWTFNMNSEEYQPAKQT